MTVTRQLNGAKYYSWCRGMKHTLLSKNKVKFINRDIAQPAHIFMLGNVAIWW